MEEIKKHQVEESVKILSMDMIQSQAVQWLWYPYIPYGKITIVQGDPGEGKTTLVLNLAALLSKGNHFDEESATGNPLSVIYQTAEDGLADTVKPRLEEAGADCARILVIDDSEKSLTMDDERLEKAIVQTGAKLLILDPIQAYLGNGIDMNRANEARDMTKKLGQLAERTGCAIVLIGHMNKAGGSKAAYRGIGSIDFFAVARSVLLVARVTEQEQIRVVAQIKNNLAEEGKPVAFERCKDGFRWIGRYDITVDELLGGYSKSNKLQQAKQYIKGLYGTVKAISSKEIEQKAKAMGISKRTLDMAKHELQIPSRREGDGWYWDLSKKE
ncbi:MAG: AAA family ATPase [Lachnospiraceae bacterium]